MREELSELDAIEPGHPLAGVLAKLARAQEHLDALDVEIASFMEREPYGISYERNPDGSDHSFRGQVREQPPLSIGILVGDCLQNMRAALDHLAWQLAIASGKAEPSRQTAFPICDTRESFRSKVTKPKVKDLTAECRAVVEKLQPFQIGGEARDHWLWHLNELSRVDRHRVPHVVGAVAQPTMSTHPVDKSADPEPYRLGKLGQSVTMTLRDSFATVKDGAEIMGWAFDPPRPDVEMHVEPDFFVTLDDGVGPAVRPVTDVLSGILSHIEGVVLPSLSKFFEDP